MSSTGNEEQIEREARRWAVLLRDEPNTSRELRREFARWVLTSAVHVQHFMAEYAFDQALRALRPLRTGTVEDWIAGRHESARPEGGENAPSE